MWTWSRQSIKLNLLRSFFFIIVQLYAFSSFSQTDAVPGDYFLKVGNEQEHLIEYTLTLNPDGTFFFHSFRDHKKGIPEKTHTYGKGIWRMDGIVVSFSTDQKEDIDEKHTLDFTNSKARFITKSPRDKTDRTVKTRLQFFKSDIFWVEKLEILKSE
ncbi:hypothetical protein [Muriicola marianensis]|nr:hypothetical protein [Muriicola marianensis]